MQRVIILLIKAYQKLSVLFPPRCRFYPSCSEYAKNAIEKKGVFAGVKLTLWRLFRCNPFFSGGYDPVD